MQNTSRIAGIVLIVLGALGLLYGGFSYTTERTGLKVGPLEVKVQEKERVNVPLLLSVGSILVGGVLLLGLGRK